MNKEIMPAIPIGPHEPYLPGDPGDYPVPRKNYCGDDRK